ncbi:MAG TPA: beta-galactosidase GalA [Verrucomicrobiae bacterium]|nr:beta-galactosidase GalA [Verrucomicrobiae bacterium]
MLLTTINSRGRKRRCRVGFTALVLALSATAGPRTLAQSLQTSGGRERLRMDFGWRFAFGHATDPSRDFDPAGSFFTYFAKAGTAAGAAAMDFDDRGWRVLNLPHDWAVEVPFDGRGRGSHGYKAIGRNFPETSVGWYRKKFFIPASDLGRHITIDFDGVFRDSQVWVNGFYLGRETSGYSPFGYNITDYLNYGGTNLVAVRVDASIEEGWFYEGAGIYRHVWLTKSAPLHVVRWGTFVTTDVKDKAADVTARVTVENNSTTNAAFEIEQSILNADGQPVANGSAKDLSVKPGAALEISSVLTVPNPRLWSIETPYLHKLVTSIRQGNSVVDRYETPFGIRTIRWDPDEGFFLNGKRVELKGTCCHQDHAGVGVAVPDELDAFRIEQLKKMGANALRTSHNAPAPELLDACDRLGMLVMDENREYGVNRHQLEELRQLIRRDRNHPSVIIWSLGNEEWSIEGTDKGERITRTMQTSARRLDPSRRFTVACDAGWGQGSSVSIDVMGFNYFTHGNPDEFHKQFPYKPCVATEEASTFSTRGVYIEDRAHQHLAAYDINKPDWGSTAEKSWSYYAPRRYVAGLFQWAGFDYRGETTPFGWPAISSQFGILDTCGFPKDNFYYYQAWWSDQPVLHLLPHWNWPGREGEEINVWAHSNCEEVELSLNGQSQGRKTMTKNSHLEWNVKYAPGTLLARGYIGGREVASAKVETTGAPAALQLAPHRTTVNADGEDVSVVTVQANDTQGRMVPTASNLVTFEIAGPGKIIGVGNGDPSSHEPDRYVEDVRALPMSGWRKKAVDSETDPAEVAIDVDDTSWPMAFDGTSDTNEMARITVYRATFNGPPDATGASFTLMVRRLGQPQSVYLNGRRIAGNASSGSADTEIALGADALRPGTNVVAIVATASEDRWKHPGGREGGAISPALVWMTVPPAPWQRSLFNGLAQVIVQSTSQPGEITLTAKSPGVADGVVKLQTKPSASVAVLP